MKDILIIVALGGLALYLFGSKSPSPIFTNPKISIPDKVSEIANEASTAIGTQVTVNVPPLNASGSTNSIHDLFI